MKKPVNSDIHLEFEFTLSEDEILQDYNILINKNIIDSEMAKSEEHKNTILLLEKLKGNSLASLNSLLEQMNETTINHSLQTCLISLVKLKGNLNQSEVAKEDLICKCAGVGKKEILSNMNSFSDFEPRSCLKKLSQNLNVANACGSCLDSIKAIIPQQIMTIDPDFHKVNINPVDFHILATKMIHEVCSTEGIEAEVTRVDYKNIYVKLNSQKPFNVFKQKKYLESLIKEKTEIQCQLYFFLN